MLVPLIFSLSFCCSGVIQYNQVPLATSPSCEFSGSVANKIAWAFKAKFSSFSLITKGTLNAGSPLYSPVTIIEPAGIVFYGA